MNFYMLFVQRLFILMIQIGLKTFAYVWRSTNILMLGEMQFLASGTSPAFTGSLMRFELSL